jgi:hypothetical protein
VAELITFFGFIDQGYLDPWTVEAQRQNEIVTGAAAATAGRLASGGYTVVYDGMVGPWFLPTFAAAAGRPSVHYAVLLPPEQVGVDRVVSQHGHGFTNLDATRHMYQQFAQVDIDPRHVLTNTDTTPPETASTIIELVRIGSLRWQIEDWSG